MPAAQNRAFARFRRFHCVGIASLRDIAIFTSASWRTLRLHPPAGTLALNYDKIPGFAKLSFK
jgi:hypothetical protein